MCFYSIVLSKLPYLRLIFAPKKQPQSTCESSFESSVFVSRTGCGVFFSCFISLSLSISHHIHTEQQVFSGPGWATSLIDLGQVPACWGIVYKEAHTCTQRREHTHRLTCTISRPDQLPLNLWPLVKTLSLVLKLRLQGPSNH